jgi:hypothetical protein
MVRSGATIMNEAVGTSAAKKVCKFEWLGRRFSGGSGRVKRRKRSKFFLCRVDSGGEISAGYDC